MLKNKPSTGSGNKIRMLLLSTLLFLLNLLPLAYFPLFRLGFEFTKYAVFLFFGIVFLFSGAIYLFKNQKIEVPDRKILLPLAFLFLSYTFSSIFSIAPLTSFLGFYGYFTGGLVYLFFLILVFLVAVQFQKEKKIILQSIFLSAIAVSVIGIYQYLNHFIKTGDYIFRIYSTVGQPNRLAFYLISVLPIAFYLFWEEKHKWTRLLYWDGFFFILLAFLLTFSRSSLLLLFIILILFCLANPLKLIINLRRVRPAQIVASILFGLLLLIFSGVMFRSFPSTVQSFTSSSLNLRLAEWEGVWNASINREPVRQLFGSGPETTYFTFFKYRPAIYNKSNEESGVGPGQARNYYLQLFAGIGLVGLIIYLIFLKNILNTAYQEGVQNKLNQAIFWSLIIISLHGLFYYQTAEVMLMFWVMAGLVIFGEPLKIGRGLRKLSMLFLFSTPILLYLIYHLVIADYYASTGRIEDLNKSVVLNPYFDIYRRDVSRYHLSEMLNNKDKDKELADQYYFLSKKAAEEALKISPEDIRNVRQLLLLNYYAGVNLDKKYQEENLPVAEKLSQITSTDPNDIDLIGLVYLDLGHPDAALKYFQMEKDLVPDTRGVYLHMGEVLKQQGKIGEAIDSYKHALKLSPNWDLAEKELENAQNLLKK